MAIIRHHGMNERLELRQLKVDGTLFRIHLSQGPRCGTRVWTERYVPPHTERDGVHGGYVGIWVTIHDWRRS